jgi:TPR repeat protein
MAIYGRLRVEGKGTVKDVADGLEWLNKSLKLKGELAAFFLGELYYDCILSCSDRKAYKYFYKFTELTRGSFSVFRDTTQYKWDFTPELNKTDAYLASIRPRLEKAYSWSYHWDLEREVLNNNYD